MIWKVHMIFTTMCKVQLEFSPLWKLQCRFSTARKEWIRIYGKTGCKMIYFSQCSRWILSCNSFKMVCNRILYLVDLACPEMMKIAQLVMPKMSKIEDDLVCKKCQKSHYFCGRILTRIVKRYWLELSTIIVNKLGLSCAKLKLSWRLRFKL